MPPANPPPADDATPTDGIAVDVTGLPNYGPPPSLIDHQWVARCASDVAMYTSDEETREAVREQAYNRIGAAVRYTLAAATPTEQPAPGAGGAGEEDELQRLATRIYSHGANVYDSLAMVALCTRLIIERDALAKFKAYVHRRLDEAGVPADPDSPHKAEGCRIGGRLDVVFAERDAPRAAVEALPVTADRVPIVPGMELWRVLYYDDEHLSEPLQVPPIAGFRVIGGEVVELMWPNGWADVRWSGLFSTYKAAKKATAADCKRNGDAYLNAKGFASRV